MLNVGFIGTGQMGRDQAKAFAQVRSCRVAAGADPSEESLKKFAAAHPAATLHADHRGLLADFAIDAVVVATPTLYHCPLVIDALRAGKPVLCEKPLARSVADGRRMIAASRRAGKLLMAGHCRRFDPDWAVFARLVKTGALGRPVLWRQFTASPIPYSAWFMDDKLGGGPMLDGAIHHFDFAHVVFGDPRDVVASSIKLTKYSAIDTATAVVRYKSGDQVMLCRSWGVAPTGNYIVDALGPRASLVFGPGRLDAPELDKKKYGYYCLIDAATRKARLIRYRRKDMYVEQAKHFIACVAGKARCLSPGTEAIKAVAVAQAVLEVAPRGGVRKVFW